MKFREFFNRQLSPEPSLFASNEVDDKEIFSEQSRSGEVSGHDVEQGKLSSGPSFGSHTSVLDITSNEPKTLAFYDIIVRNLTYKVAVNSKEKGKTQKVLLNGVNAEAYHGQILAIAGPSGSGKTTLIDALAGRVARKSLEGEILVNGELIDSAFKRISGYVMQDDALFPMLTVRETFLYSALLRLPSSMSLAEKRNRVGNMIKELGLAQCADTRVGDERRRGVSGGEKRRVSIGSDLIHDPAVLFLDEPTSGLDSTSALNVMQHLQRMAQSGRKTVLLSIHQPSYRVLDTIDRVLVLGRGNVVYHGPPQGLKHHFDPLGRSMPEFVNVIEYVLDTMGYYDKSPDRLSSLISLQESTKYAAGLNQEKNVINSAADLRPEYARSFLAECVILSHRNSVNNLRTPELFLSRLGVLSIGAVLVGSVFLGARVSAEGVKKRAAYIGFLAAFLGFTSLDALGSLIEERQIFIRETSRGAYRAASYVVAGAVVAVPLLLILAILFSGISYFTVGLVEDTEAFLFFVLIIWLTLCMANSYVYLISSLAPDMTIGNALGSGTLAIFFLFSGFFLSRNQIPKYWIWLHYMSLFKYPYECLLKNEFGNKHFENATWGNLGTSEDVLISFSAGSVHQWINVLAMIAIFLGYRVFFWIVLRYFPRNVRK